jgi:hypothetical protein
VSGGLSVDCFSEACDKARDVGANQTFAADWEEFRQKVKVLLGSTPEVLT